MESLNTLIEYGEPAIINSNLRKVLFDYMETELKIGTTTYFEELLPQLNYLFNFLEEAAEAKQNPASNIIRKNAGLEDENCAPWLFADYLLYRVAVFLVTTLEPERIYRVIHEPFAQQQPFTDLVIVLPGSMQENPFKEYETIIEAGCSLGTNLSFSLHHASRVNAAMAEGHIFYSLVCTKENLIYWHEEKEWPVTNSEKLKHVIQNAFHLFQNNFSRAEAFLHHAQVSMQQQNNRITAFFLQQATELCCRAILTALTGHDKKTHSIAALKKHCRRCTSLIDQIFPNNTEEEQRLLKLLDDAYICARYNEDFSPALSDLEVLLQKVQLLHSEVMSAINHRLGLVE